MTKQQFMRRFHDNHWDYDYDNNVINLGRQLYCRVSEDPEGVMIFLIYSDKTKENIEIKYNLETQTIRNLSSVKGRYKDRDLYIGLYSILGFLELLEYDDFKIEYIYKFGWLIDIALNPPY